VKGFEEYLSVAPARGKKDVTRAIDAKLQEPVSVTASRGNNLPVPIAIHGKEAFDSVWETAVSANSTEHPGTL